MKIAWFTPFSTNSAIGRYSQSITNKLIDYCEVDLWSSDKSNLLPTELKIFHYQGSEDLSAKLRGYDFIIYNMGNNLAFHKDIYEVSNKVKGIVILHDYVMQHFFAAYYQFIRNKQAYIEEMERLYGIRGRDIAIDSINNKRKPFWETDEVSEYPFFEKAIENAIGVIVHSGFCAEKVKQKFLGPIDMIYHPFYSYDRIDLDRCLKKSDLGIPEDKVLIVSTGHVNPNKRIDRIINILGEHRDLAQRVIYVIIGPHNHMEYYSNLRKIVERYNLHNIMFLGYQPDEMLYAYLLNADIIINLRYPTTEGAPGSLIEQMYFGKAIIVNNTGFYGEMPDDCVVKIDVDEKEQLNLYNALTKLIDDEIERRNIGIRAKQFASENFTPQKYCQKFIGFLKKIKGSIPITNLIDKISLELSMMGVLYDSPIVDIISKEIYEILPKSSEGR
jgi:glycosyltransferase involved in cell wall biosynthesis